MNELMNYIGNYMRPGVSWGVLGYPWVSWGVLWYPGVSLGNQTDPLLDTTLVQFVVSFNIHFVPCAVWEFEPRCVGSVNRFMFRPMVGGMGDVATSNYCI